LRILPKPPRRWLYRGVARNRYAPFDVAATAPCLTPPFTAGYWPEMQVLRAALRRGVCVFSIAGL